MHILPHPVEFQGYTFLYSPHVNPSLPLHLWMASAALRGDVAAHEAPVMMLGKDGELRSTDGHLYWSARLPNLIPGHPAARTPV